MMLQASNSNPSSRRALVATTQRTKNHTRLLVDHTYRDFSRYLHYGGQIEKHKKSDANFPAKLHQMLSEPKLSHIITWMPHGRAWKILDKELLMSKAVPAYFVQKRFESFTRQLSGWGFKRLHQSGADFACYYHECFLQCIPELTPLMKRAPSNGKPAPYPEGEPNFYHISKLYPLSLPAPNMIMYLSQPESSVSTHRWSNTMMHRVEAGIPRRSATDTNATVFLCMPYLDTETLHLARDSSASLVRTFPAPTAMPKPTGPPMVAAPEEFMASSSASELVSTRTNHLTPYYHNADVASVDANYQRKMSFQPLLDTANDAQHSSHCIAISHSMENDSFCSPGSTWTNCSQPTSKTDNVQNNPHIGYPSSTATSYGSSLNDIHGRHNEVMPITLQSQPSRYQQENTNISNSRQQGSGDYAHTFQEQEGVFKEDLNKLFDAFEF